MSVILTGILPGYYHPFLPPHYLIVENPPHLVTLPIIKHGIPGILMTPFFLKYRLQTSQV